MDWLILPKKRMGLLGRPNADARWNVKLSDCDRAHAESVLATLEEADGCPSDLELLPLVAGKPKRRFLGWLRG